MNLNEIETSAPLKFRAIPKAPEMPSKPFYFTLQDAVLVGGIGSFRRLYLQDQYYPPDQFTGHVDKDKREIYGGNVFHFSYKGEGRLMVKYAYLFWNSDDGQWWLWDMEKKQTAGCWSNCLWEIEKRGLQIEVIGNIHNPDALPEEVRRMLDD